MRGNLLRSILPHFLYQNVPDAANDCLRDCFWRSLRGRGLKRDYTDDEESHADMQECVNAAYTHVTPGLSAFYFGRQAHSGSGVRRGSKVKDTFMEQL